MLSRLNQKPLHYWGNLSSAAFLLCMCLSASAQTPMNPHQDSAINKQKSMQVRGCLGHVLDEFHFSSLTLTSSENLNGWVVLTGNTAGLDKYVDRELILEGSKGDALRIEGYFDPIPSFEVVRIVKVVEKAEPQLDASFTNAASWRAERIREYGVKLAHPEGMVVAESPGATFQSNFATNASAEVVSSFDIPGMAYPNANLRGGSFTIFVNPEIKTRASCMQFLEPGSRSAPEPYDAGRIKYLKAVTGSAAMGTWYSEYYFHAFQNGQCYEVAFQLVEYNAHNADTGCNIPLLSNEDNLTLIKPLIGSVTFFRPQGASASKKLLPVQPNEL
jgi:hypothetical protein